MIAQMQGKPPAKRVERAKPREVTARRDQRCEEPLAGVQAAEPIHEHPHDHATPRCSHERLAERLAVVVFLQHKELDVNVMRRGGDALFEGGVKCRRVRQHPQLFGGGNGEAAERFERAKERNIALRKSCGIGAGSSFGCSASCRRRRGRRDAIHAEKQVADGTKKRKQDHGPDPRERRDGSFAGEQNERNQRPGEQVGDE